MTPVLIKKYTGRKYYVPKGNTEPTGYIGIEGIIAILRKGKDVKIVCNKTGVDVTEGTLKEALKKIPVSVEKLIEMVRFDSGDL